MSYQVTFVLNFIFCYSVMKLASWYISSNKTTTFKDFVLSPDLHRNLRSTWADHFSEKEDIPDSQKTYNSSVFKGAALWIDKKFISHMPPICRRIYLWAAVVIPSPLFINVPLLTFFGLEHG